MKGSLLNRYCTMEKLTGVMRWPFELVDSAVGSQLVSRTDWSITFCIVPKKKILWADRVWAAYKNIF